MDPAGAVAYNRSMSTGPTSTRVCGACTLCCGLYAVPEIAKPEGQGCRHCSAAGCGIHATRPQSCRNFECFWLMDPDFPEDLRPDRSGVVAYFNGDDHDAVVLQLDPERPDALATGPAAELLSALLGRFDPVFVVCGNERMMLSRRADGASGARGA